MSAIDVNKCLPPELTVESVDDILYRIGFVFRFSQRSTEKSKDFQSVNNLHICFNVSNQRLYHYFIG